MRKRPFRQLLWCFFSSLFLTACAHWPEPTCRPCVEGERVEAKPIAPPLQPARWEDLPAGWAEDRIAEAWGAFLSSCQALSKRVVWPYWRQACTAAPAVPRDDSAAQRQFFQTYLSPFLLTNPDGTATGLVTGYYEPLLAGSRTRNAVARYPLLAVPQDLLVVELSALFPELKDKRVRGRLLGNTIVPYYTRAEIERREHPAEALLWVEDPVELFFLQIQGSGRVRLPSGEMVRVGYADQNGHPYQSIGRVLIDAGELKPEQASMQGIQAWARQHPERLSALLNQNPSYVFFRELPQKFAATAGPPGALGVALTPGRSIAVDSRYIPLGSPVFLATTMPGSEQPLHRLVLAQDTGGAIKGVVRADFFWGFGAAAGAQAGRMKQRGQMWVFLPRDYPLP